METLRQLVESFESADDFEMALKNLVIQVKQHIGCGVASVYLLDDHRNRFVLAATQGLNARMVGRAYLPLYNGVVGQVGQRQEPINLADANKDPNFCLVSSTGESSFRGFLAAPVAHQGVVLAVLVLRQTQDSTFPQSDESFLITLAVRLAPDFAHAKATGQFDSVLAQTLPQVTLTGVASASGVGLGLAVLDRPMVAFEKVPLRAIADTDIQPELEKYRHSVALVEAQMLELEKQVGGRLSFEEMSLFDVYRRLLNDPSLTSEIETVIGRGYWAQGALAKVISQHAYRFEQMDDPYLRARATDIRDIGTRLLQTMNNAPVRTLVFEQPVVLIGEEITASSLLEADLEKVVGIATRQGSLNSHMAIVARSLGIPTVVGVTELAVSGLIEQELIVDGDRGEVIYHFQESVRQQYLERIEQDRKLWALYAEHKRESVKTSDGTGINLYLNASMINAHEETDVSINGVGLFRSEMIFLSEDQFPTQESQMSVYRKQLEAFAPLPVTIRTLDIGGDKTLSYLPIHESNPFLGWRGIRVSLDYPQTFVVQIRAMLMASEGLNNLRILLPMVSTISEVLKARAIIIRVYEQLLAEGVAIEKPLIGIMVEVPAMVFQIEALSEMIDFISIGTNDLIQYLLAVDRNNARVAHLYEPFHPAVLKVLHLIVKDCALFQLPVYICGEMAGEPALALLLVGMGYRHLSMSQRNLVKVQWALRQVSVVSLNHLTQQVLLQQSVVELKAKLSEELISLGLSQLVPAVTEQVAEA